MKISYRDFLKHGRLNDVAGLIAARHVRERRKIRGNNNRAGWNYLSERGRAVSVCR